MGKIILMTVGTGSGHRDNDTVSEDELLINNATSALATIDCILQQGKKIEKLFLIASSQSKKNAEFIKKFLQNPDEKQAQLGNVRFFENYKSIQVDIQEITNFLSTQQTFEDMNNIMSKVLGEHSEKDIIIDYTRGTKAMAPAAYMLAILHNAQLSYVQGKKNENDQIDLKQGKIVNDENPKYVRNAFLLEKVKSLFKDYDFKAIVKLIENESEFHKNYKDIFKNIKDIANCYNNWDSLNFSYIKDVQPIFVPDNFLPQITLNENISNWLRDLNCPINKRENLTDDEKIRNAQYLVRLFFDMYANALRKLQNNWVEDANIRAYKMLEILAQYYIFKQGIDFYHIPIEGVVAEKRYYRDDLEKVGIKIRDGASYLSNRIDRSIAILFIKILNQQIGEGLEKFKDRAEDRNNSILVHGFEHQQNDDVRKFVDDVMSFALKNFEDYRVCCKEHIKEFMFLNSLSDQGKQDIEDLKTLLNRNLEVVR